MPFQSGTSLAAKEETMRTLYKSALICHWTWGSSCSSHRIRRAGFTGGRSD
uniref:Uncharacterized protein n=1 Tax=Arundo donax TaxID=35708 RepID=A0A0A9CJG9_ARUDO